MPNELCIKCNKKIGSSYFVLTGLSILLVDPYITSSVKSGDCYYCSMECLVDHFKIAVENLDKNSNRDIEFDWEKFATNP